MNIYTAIINNKKVTAFGTRPPNRGDTKILGVHKKGQKSFNDIAKKNKSKKDTEWQKD